MAWRLLKWFNQDQYFAAGECVQSWRLFDVVVVVFVVEISECENQIEFWRDRKRNVQTSLPHNRLKTVQIKYYRIIKLKHCERTRAHTHTHKRTTQLTFSTPNCMLIAIFHVIKNNFVNLCIDKRILSFEKATTKRSFERNMWNYWNGHLDKAKLTIQFWACPSADLISAERSLRLTVCLSVSNTNALQPAFRCSSLKKMMQPNYQFVLVYVLRTQFSFAFWFTKPTMNEHKKKWLMFRVNCHNFMPHFDTQHQFCYNRFGVRLLFAQRHNM